MDLVDLMEMAKVKLARLILHRPIGKAVLSLVSTATAVSTTTVVSTTRWFWLSVHGGPGCSLGVPASSRSKHE